MTVLRDATGAHARMIASLMDARGRRVLEVGCGEGRLTWPYAEQAASVLAIDPDAASIAAARAAMPAQLRGRVTLDVADVLDAELGAGRFDLVYFTWSL